MLNFDWIVEQRIREAIEVKVKGGELSAPPSPERAPGKVVDLMEVLKRSLREHGAPPKARPSRSSRPRAASKRRAAS